MAVLVCTMCIEALPTVLEEQPLQLRRAKPFLSPGHFPVGASPRLSAERGQATLEKAAVELGVVCHDQICTVQQLPQAAVVDPLTAYLLVVIPVRAVTSPGIGWPGSSKYVKPC